MRFLGISMRAAGTTAVVLAAASACSSSSAPERDTTGPLESTPALVWFYELDPAGATFSDGIQTIQVSGTSKVTIESVTVNGGGKALEFLGARLGLPGRPDDFNQMMPGYPPKAIPASYQTAATDAVLEPGARYMLIVGYRVKNDHVMDRRTGITVNYRTGNHLYQTTYPAGLVTCPPPLTDTQCSAAADRRYGHSGLPS